MLIPNFAKYFFRFTDPVFAGGSWREEQSSCKNYVLVSSPRHAEFVEKAKAKLRVPAITWNRPSQIVHNCYRLSPGIFPHKQNPVDQASMCRALFKKYRVLSIVNCEIQSLSPRLCIT
jgi:hypothetical protein